jgi:hypothetical protein
MLPVTLNLQGFTPDAATERPHANASQQMTGCRRSDDRQTHGLGGGWTILLMENVAVQAVKSIRLKKIKVMPGKKN